MRVLRLWTSCHGTEATFERPSKRGLSEEEGGSGNRERVAKQACYLIDAEL
jgi:hypothetical protein